MEIDKSVYYPLTPFHLICSTILRNRSKNATNILILDNNLFNDKIIQEIKKSKKWTLIFVLKKSPRFLTSLQNIKYLDHLYHLLNSGNFNVYIFSPGINLCNLIINNISKNNIIFLCDDGIAPYYFENNILFNWEILTQKNIIRNFFLKILKVFFNKNYILNFSRIHKIILLNNDLAELVKENHTLTNIENDQKFLSLKEVSEYYTDLLPIINLNYKIVYFHSSNLKIDEYIISELLKKFNSSEIFHCFRQRAKLTNSFDYIANNNNVPWEILHFVFFNHFKDSVLLSTNLTTAFINTINPYINNHRRFIFSKDLNYKLPNIEKIIEIINKNSNCNLSIIKSIDEI